MSELRFQHPIEVRFRDLDALGHVNNAVYLTYFETARLAWWARVTGRHEPKDLDVILARAEVDYRSPALFGERLDVGAGCLSIGRSSLVMGMAIHEQKTRRLVAEARKVLVCYDYAAQRSRPISDLLRRQLLAQDPDAEARV